MIKMLNVCIFRYVDQFSKSLYVEYKNSGIDVQCQVLLFHDFKVLGVKVIHSYSMQKILEDFRIN